MTSCQNYGERDKDSEHNGECANGLPNLVFTFDTTQFFRSAIERQKDRREQPTVLS